MTLVPLTVRPDPRTVRAVRAVADPLTAPLPRLTDVVHAVTATFGATGWTLRFAPSGHQAVVERLVDADVAARRLVGSALGLSPASVRVRIAPDDETLVAVRRDRAPTSSPLRSSRRGRSHDM